MFCTLMSRYGNQCFLWREVETVDETHKHLRQSRLGIPLDCRQVPKHVTTKTSNKLLLNSDPPRRRPHIRVEAVIAVGRYDSETKYVVYLLSATMTLLSKFIACCLFCGHDHGGLSCLSERK